MVGNINDGIDFATTSNEQKKKKDKNHVTCHRCGEKGHYANEITKCKAATETTVSGEEEEYEDSNPSMSFEFCGCHIETKNFNICKSNKKVPNTWFCLIINQQSMCSITKTC